MTPAARTQAAIELLDAILTAAKDGGAAADTIVSRYFAARRYAGSKDRRAVREQVYAAIRACGERPPSGRAAMLALASRDPVVAATFDDSPHGPAAIDPSEAAARHGVAPAWLIKLLKDSGLDHDTIGSLIDRAPLDIRVNALMGSPEDAVASLGAGEPIPGLPDALRLPTGTNVEALGGLAEVQDAGSQIVAMAARASAGMKVVDLCAGGGGKTLALAAAMRNEGEILATDTDRARLSRLEPRAERAGVGIATTRLLDPGQELMALDDWLGKADVVLVDAPCSGTGTWRRNPEARWRLTPVRIARLVETQRRITAIGATLVKPGGALIYIVCSLLDAEGAGQVDLFLKNHPGWKADRLSLPAGKPHGAGLRLTPLADGTDGFFVARLNAPC
ncbi:RsmB/NOP family class I SAM-dependent RNA methyltransferase [Sphingomonas sp. SUN019]|uniref:RsmB/NOP family class I SAM-dependent RNA methyltransferase n=1 Tax=Sphingomonas sp. SUN019 TaxID=2937788 RepID=UPI0021648851|nr:RsmB/NOP family class I SAM-dependent RNA methyltransferase [Sphingomonas sp. SUN019]UVO49202.1 RsmB/NOP family class I SAM-dependent RNA methyltransferase [Sphingomonas sp. SUN019]